MTRAFAIAILAFAAMPAAAEVCHVESGGQYGKLTLCASSVLAPQGGNTYGPENLVARSENEGKAWCEGVRGPGIGESLTQKLDGAMTARTLFLTNGYDKSDAIFQANGRVRRATFETSRGFKTTVTLQDSKQPQSIVFPKSKVSWVKLTILDVYRGKTNDTCISQFGLTLDEGE